MALYTEQKFMNAVDKVRWHAVMMDQARQANDPDAYEKAFADFELAKMTLQTYITDGLDLTPPPRRIVMVEEVEPVEEIEPPAPPPAEVTGLIVPVLGEPDLLRGAASGSITATPVADSAPPLVIETPDGPVTMTSTSEPLSIDVPAAATDPDAFEPTKTESER